MQGRLLLKLFSQVVQSLQTTDFCEQPLLVTFLYLLQTLPGIGNVLQKGTAGRIYFQLYRVLESQGHLPPYTCVKKNGATHTETILPSEGMKAGLLLSLSLVCRVLKFISS